MAENRIPIPGFVGPSYQALSDRFNNQRTVNMYLETDTTTGTAKDAAQSVLVGTAGMDEVAEFEQPFAIRQLYVPSSNQGCMYAFCGNQVYFTTDALSWQLCSGNLVSIIGYVSVADNGTDIVAVDGYSGYKIRIGTAILTEISSPNFYPADTIDFLNGYFICNRKNTAQFFTSDLYATTWPALNLATKSSTPDSVVGIITNNKLLYVMGSQSIEIWSNTGNSATTPFEQLQGQYISIGCYAFGSIVQLNGTVFWLGKTINGSGIVYVMDGQSAKEVSTKPVSLALQSYANLGQATAFGWQEEGHYFYALNVPGAPTTWVYDYTENQWHEEQSFDVVPANFSPGNSSGIAYQQTNVYNPYSDGIVFGAAVNAGSLVGVVLNTVEPGAGGRFPAGWSTLDMSTANKNWYFIYKFSNGEYVYPCVFQNSDEWRAFEIGGVKMPANPGESIILDWESTDDDLPIDFILSGSEEEPTTTFMGSDNGFATFDTGVQRYPFGAYGCGNANGPIVLVNIKES